MSCSRRLISILIVIIPVIAMAVYGGYYVAGQFEKALKNTQYIVAEQLANNLASTASVGKTTITPFGTALVENIKIFDPKNDKIIWVSVNKVRVNYNFMGILRGKSAQAIRSIELIDPKILLIRRQNGKFNLQDLLKPKAPSKGPQFSGKINLDNAEVIFEDAKSGKKLHVRNIDAIIDAIKQPEYAFTVNISGIKNMFASIWSSGHIDTKTFRISADVNTRGISIPFASKYFKLPPKINVKSGTMDVFAGVNLLVDKSSKDIQKMIKSFSAMVELKNISASLRDSNINLNKLNGRIAITDNLAVVDLNLNTSGTKVEIAGNAQIPLTKKIKPEDSAVNLSVVVPKINFAEISKLVRLPKSAGKINVEGIGSLEAKITGNTIKPHIETNIFVPRVSARSYSADNIKVSAVYDNKTAYIKSASLNAYGADITAIGSIENLGTKNPVSLNIQGHVSNADISKFPMKSGIRAKGLAVATFKMTGLASKPAISAKANIVDGEVNGLNINKKKQSITFGSAYISTDILGKKVVLKKFLINNLFGGTVGISGFLDLEGKTANLNLSIEAVKIKTIASIAGVEDISGALFYCGKVKGKLSNLSVDGIIEVFKGKYRNYEFGYIRSEVSGNKYKIDIKNALVMHFPAELKFSGNALNPLSKRISFTGKASIKRFNVREALDIIKKKLDVSGTIAADVDVSGILLIGKKSGNFPIENLQGQADIVVENGTLLGYPVDSCNAKLIFKDKVITIQKAVAQSAKPSSVSSKTEFSASGTLSLEDKAIDIEYLFYGFDIGTLKDKIGKYVRASGFVSAKGVVKGAWDNPQATLDASIENFAINRTPFDLAKISVKMADRSITESIINFKRGEQSYEFVAKNYQIDKKTLGSGEGSFKNIDIPDVWDMFLKTPYLATSQGINKAIAYMPKITDGTLNGTFSVSGDVAKPNGSLTLNADHVGLDIRRIDSVDANLTMKDGIIDMTQFVAISDNTNFTATAFPLLDTNTNRTNIEVALANLDLSRLHPWLKDKTPEGNLAAEISIIGDLKHPQIISSFEVENPVYHGFKFDRIRATRIEVNDNNIDINDGIIIAVGEHQAVIKGFLPWSWNSMSMPADKPLEMYASLDKQKLSMLGAVIGKIDEKTAKGIVDGVIGVKGTPKELNYDGYLKIADGTLAIKGFNNKFNNINFDISFDGKQVKVNKASFDSSIGGKAYIVPGSYVAMMSGSDKNNLNIKIASDGLIIDEKNLVGYQEAVKLKIGAGISITGTFAKPVIADAEVDGQSGGITFSEGKISFATPEKNAEKPPAKYPVDPQFAISFRVGKNVVVSPPQMRIIVGGGGFISGSLSNPILNPTKNVIIIKEGILQLATSRLRIVSGGTISIGYLDKIPDLKVNLNASTFVNTKNKFGEKERYKVIIKASGNVINMQIDLKSDPEGLTREQILAALGHVEGILSSGDVELKKELGNVLTAVGSGVLLTPLENLFVEDLGFEQFSLEYSAGETSPMSVFVSRKLFSNFYASYFQKLSSSVSTTLDKTFEVRFGYRIGGNINLSVGIDDLRTKTINSTISRSF